MRKLLIALLLLESFMSASEVLTIENGNVSMLEDDGTEVYFRIENISKMYAFYDNGKPKFYLSLMKEKDDILIMKKDNFIKLKEAFLNKR